jgi:hypothetical protein
MPKPRERRLWRPAGSGGCRGKAREPSRMLPKLPRCQEAKRSCGPSGRNPERRGWRSRWRLRSRRRHRENPSAAASEGRRTGIARRSNSGRGRRSSLRHRLQRSRRRESRFWPEQKERCSALSISLCLARRVRYLKCSLRSSLWRTLSIRVGSWVVRTLYKQGANPTMNGSHGDRAEVPGIEAPGTEGTDDP